MKLTRAFLLVLSLLFSFSGNCLSDEIRNEINTHVAAGDFAAAQSYIETELTKPHDYQTKKDLNQTLVSILIYSSQYKEALEVAFATIDALKPMDDRSDFYFLIGCIFYAVEDYEKSTQYLDLSLSSQNPSSKVKALLMLSDIYLQTEQETKVLETLEKANQIAAEFEIAPQTKDHIAQQYHFHSGNFETCKEICNRIVSDSTSFLNTRCNALSVIGDCLVEQDSLSESAEYYEAALALTIETGDPDLIKTTSWKLIEVYEKLGLQDKANGYHKIYNDAINDSNYFSIDKYRDLYQLEQERQLAALKKDTQKPASNGPSTFYIVITTLLALVGSFFSYYYYKKTRNAKTSEANKTTSPGKKIQINPSELEKIRTAVDRFITNENYLTPKITLKTFCEESGITSERYLSQFINEEYEKSFSNFVNELRIVFAHDRIKSNKTFRNYKIEVMAKECGFGSRKTFERVFSAKYGKSAADYISESIN